MRKLKKYELKENPPNARVALDKRTMAVRDVLKGGPKDAKEIFAALGKYTQNGVFAALHTLRKAGLLKEE